MPRPRMRAVKRTEATCVHRRQYPAGNALKYVQNDACCPACTVIAVRPSTVNTDEDVFAGVRRLALSNLRSSASFIAEKSSE